MFDEERISFLVKHQTGLHLALEGITVGTFLFCRIEFMRSYMDTV